LIGYHSKSLIKKKDTRNCPMIFGLTSIMTYTIQLNAVNLVFMHDYDVLSEPLVRLPFKARANKRGQVLIRDLL
jgi:hypothetical protein